jgi:DNA (cytosine-5)-methyltransferase 1
MNDPLTERSQSSWGLACRSERVSRSGIVELFAGTGSVARGFERTGRFETLLLTDVDPCAAETFQINHPGGVRYLCSEITDTPTEQLMEEAGDRFISGVLGCPPCQGFSSAGRRNRHDWRNGLLSELFRVIADLEPLFFVLENVPRVLDDELFIARLKEAGRQYRIWGGVLNTALYGTPQTRQRAVVLGYHRDLGIMPSPPRPTHFGQREIFVYAEGSLVSPMAQPALRLLGIHSRANGTQRLPYMAEDLVRAGFGHLPDLVTIEEAIGDLAPALAHDGPAAYAGAPSGYATSLRADAAYNHKRRHGADMIARMAEVAEGGMAACNAGGTRYFRLAYGRLHRRGLLPTVTTNFHNPGAGRFWHHEQARTLTVREAARLQGMSDGFQFHGPLAAQQRLVGNAFPVPLADAIARHIVAELGGNLH